MIVHMSSQSAHKQDPEMIKSAPLAAPVIGSICRSALQ